jgi:glycosyltransferase involved in cell wall biosynthesis
VSGGPRILLVSAEYPPQPGGIGDQTALLAAHLAETGRAVAVLTSGTGEQQQTGSVQVYAAVRRWNWRLGGIVRDVLRDTGAEIVHIQYQTGMYGMHPAINTLPALRGVRRFPRAVSFVTTFHDLRDPYLFPKAGPLRPRVTRLLARASDAVIATNGADAAVLTRWNPETHLVPIGSSLPAAMHADPAAVRSRHGIPADAALLTTFGLINHSKGIETLIDALALLRASGIKAVLLLVGAGTGASDTTNAKTERRLIAQCAERGVADAVMRTGPLPADDVAAVLAASDVCLLPFRDGASPRRSSLIAALTQGIPIVTTTPVGGVYAGLPEPRDGETMCFIPPDDAPALAEATRRILHDAACARRLCAGARTYAAHVTWPAIIRQHLDIYAAITATTPHAEPAVAAASPGER